jgi:hypothetical protein
MSARPNKARVTKTVLVLAGLLTSGCFDAPEPLDREPMLDRDMALLGSWLCIPDAPALDAGTATFVVAPEGSRSYSITFTEPDKTPERYSAFASDTPVGRVLNVRLIDPKPKGDDDWVFVRYLLPRRGALSVELLSDDAMKDTPSDPKAIRSALGRLKANPELFVGYCVCTRMREATK